MNEPPPPLVAAMGDSIIDFSFHEEMKRKCMQIIYKEQQVVQKTCKRKLGEMCKNSTVHSPGHCKKTFVRQMNCLHKKFENTTNDTDGGVEFQQDVAQLAYNLQNLLHAGIPMSVDVSFPKLEKPSDLTMF